MYRRPARDRNYEFWGDHTFYGENPPQAAVISWLNKKQLGQVSLKVTDAAGREVRELSGAAFANSNKPGIQSACWDLRVQPAPAPPPQEGRGRGRGERGQAAEGGGRGQTQESPYGAACPPLQTAGGGGGFGGGGAQLGGPYVIGGVYTVSLVVDGKTVDSKPLRVADDPEVVLTSADRKRQYDMAMEMHTLQPRVTEAGTAFGSLNRQVAELTTTAASRSDVPVDVKGQLEAFKKELDGLAPRLAIPQGGRGGGGGGRGNNESLTGKVGQAKNGFMSGMVVGEQTLRAYTEVKSQAPKTIADLNAAIAKATTLSATLARYNLTLTVPQPVKAIEAAPVRKASVNPKQ
jgi:hypothetical protein